MSGIPSQKDTANSAERWAALDSKYERLAEPAERQLLSLDRVHDLDGPHDHDPPLRAAC
jgi:hypothetical protein